MSSKGLSLLGYPESITAFTSAYDKQDRQSDQQKFATAVLNETYYNLSRRFANRLEKGEQRPLHPRVLVP